MKRVSIRTLVLTVELLGFFVAYQCLAFIPPAKTPTRTRAVRLDDRPNQPMGANVPDDSTVSTGDQPENIADCTPALRRAMEAREARRVWYHETVADPNDRAEPDDSGPGPEEVE
jgi:hypothetical protein